MAFKYGFTVISTNFDLEPVLAEYMKTYPNGDLQNYQIVFKTEDEHKPGSKSYVIVYEHRTGRGNTPRLYDFLKSYCTVNDLVAVANPLGHILPDISGRQGHIFGHYKDAT